ncbi:MAG: aldo/keto reductase [Thermoanaerobaculia bacterium]|nr:aldo/keto reductase [Thermoanaerobaculia bacterium]
MTEKLAGVAHESGTFTIGGDLEVHRLGFGAMRLCGENVWGPPPDREEAHRVLRRALDLGIDFLDTADSYGPYVDEELIAEALHPYPDSLVVATKGGLVRPRPEAWDPKGTPEHLREACEGSLERLRVERIDLYQLHALDPEVPPEDQFGTLKELQEEGKIRHVGLSNVEVGDIRKAREILDVVTVQNRYNLQDRSSEAVVDYCTENDIGFIPWFPLATGDLAEDPVLSRIGKRRDSTAAQVALAWLLARSPVMLPIPGTSSVEHLEENAAAAALELEEDDLRELDSRFGVTVGGGTR